MTDEGEAASTPHPTRADARATFSRKGRRGAHMMRGNHLTTRMLDTRDDSFDMKLQQMKCDLAALNVELKLCKLAYLLRKYSPSQPRLPAGSPEGG
jgi:hypothetical protein